MTDAIAIVTNILDANWTKAPKPSIQDIANLDKGDGKRVRLQDKDVIRIFETAHNEAQPELLYDFVNEHINLTLDIRTVKSRERLSELRNEVRRILHGFRKGDGINFDRIIFKTRTDLSDRTKKLFRYTMQCEIVTFSLTAETESTFINPTTNAVSGANIYQTLSARLTELSLLTPSDGQSIVGNGDNWVVASTGDISSVVAGTGLTGGGVSGDVTLNVSGLTISQLAANTLQLSSESFADNDTTLMTSAAIKDYVDTIVGGAPGALDTLNELAAAINDDASFASTITTSIGTKLAKASNLSDLANAGTARSNLGLGSMALLNSIDISSHTNLAVGTGLTLSGDTLSITDDSISEVKLDVTNTPTDNYILSYDQASGGFTWIAPASVGENNQNAFSTVAVSGQTSVTADSTTDTLTFVGGANVTITTTAGSDTITFTATDTNTEYSVGDGGLTQNNFTNALKTKLDGIEASADVTDSANVKSALGGAIGSNALQIGDGSTTTTFPGSIVVTGTTTTNHVETVSTSNGVIFEGSNADNNEVSLKAGTVSADRTITLPDATGTIALTSQLTTDTNTQNVFTSSFVDSTNDILLRLTKSGASSGTQDIKFVAGSNVSLTHTDANNITISSTDTNTVYTHPNHSGEVTSSADGATVIASNVVDEDNLKVTNSPTDNYLLSYDQASGGFTWIDAASAGGANQNAFSNVAVSGQTTVSADASTDTLTLAAGSNITITTAAGTDTVTIASTDTNTDTNTQNVFTSSFVDSSNDTILRLTKSGASSGTQDIKFVAGSNVTLTPNGTNLTIAATDTNTEYSVGDGGLTQNNFTNTLKSKLDAIEAAADVTDLANITTALAALTGDDTLVMGDSGDDTTVRVRGNLVVTGTTTTENVETLSTSNGVVFEGSAANNNELTLKAGTVSADRTVTIPDATFTIPTQDTTYSIGDGGLTQNNFTNTLKTKLDGIAASANNFSLPTAASDTLGGIKVGANLSINGSGVLSAAATGVQGSIANTQVAFGSGTSIAGDVNFTYDSSNEILKVGEIIRVGYGSNTFPAFSFFNAPDLGLRYSSIAGADVLRVTVDGEDQVDFINGAIQPVTNNDIDLGTSSLQFKNAYFDGTVEADAITLNGTALGALATLDSVAAGQIDANAVDSSELKDGAIDESHLNATNSPTDNHLLSYDQASGGFTWIAAGAGGENNQNAFSTISVSGSSDVVADGTTDTLTLAVTGNLSIATTPSTDTVVIGSVAGDVQLANSIHLIGGSSNNLQIKTAASVGSGATISFIASNGNSISNLTIPSGDGTISTSDTNTTYSAGIGIALSGTTFALTDPANLNALDESSDATDDKILLWDESASEWKHMTLDNLQDSIDTTATGGAGEAFKTISVSGQSNVVADAAADTLTLVAGSNVTITTNASSDTITFASTDTNTEYSVGDGGLTQNNFTNTLKSKLDGIAASANNYAISSDLLDENDMATNSATKVASQQSIKAYVDAVVAGAPGALDTLNELAAAINDDASFASTITTSIGTKLAKASNLSDLANAGTARSNLGLGTASTLAGNGAVANGNAGLVTGDVVFDYIAAQGFGTGAGDITAVVAGTGLSGGATSGSATLNVSGLTVSELAANSLQISSESFADNDTSLMTSAAIADKIEAYGYTTNTGTITGSLGAANRVAFASSSSALTNSASFFYTDASNTLNIANGGAAGTLTSGSHDLILRNSGATSHSKITVAYDHPNSYIALETDGSGNVEIHKEGAVVFKLPNTIGSSGQVLKVPSSGTTLEWAADTNTDTNTQNVFTSSFVDSSNDTILRLTKSGASSGTQDIKFVAGSNVTLTPSGTNLTIAATDTNTEYSVGDGGLTQNNFTNTLKAKLDAIEASATADQTASEITALLNDVASYSLGTNGSGSIAVNHDMTVAGDLTVTGTTITNNVETVSTSNGVQFEGSAANNNEILLKAGTVSADRTIVLPDASGTISLSDTNTNQLTTFTLTGDSGTNQTIAHGNTLDVAGGTGIATAVGNTDTVTVNLSHLGIESLSDPGADRLLIWDDSAGAIVFATPNSNLAISGTNVNATDTNTNTFRTITAGSNTLDATETLAFTAGSNVTISESGGAVTIASTDTNTDTNTQNVFTSSFVDSSNDTILRLTKSGASSGTQDIKFVAGSNVSLTPSGTNLTIAATDTNTEYSAGTGLALSGTTFSMADPADGTSIDEGTIAADDRMPIWDESASSWKYVTIDNLQDEIDTTASGGAGEAFKTIAVSGQSNVVADSATDTLTLAAGSNVTLTTNASSDTVTITSSNTVYTHPNHSGEVTSSSDGATVIASDVVDEDNLKVSNTASDNQVLSYNAATGGFTWVNDANTDTNTQNVFATSFVDSSNDTILRLTKSGASSGTQDIKFVAGSNIALTPSGTNLTIAATDTNTEYAAGTNISLSGTTFNVSSTPSFSTVTVATDIIHDGDTNTKIGFTTDVITLQTGGSTKLTVNNAGIKVGSGATVTTIATSFTDNDTSLMTSQAIKEKIESYSYVTANQNTTGSAGTVTSIGNLTGEVTSTNRATIIADNVVDEANLKVSNTASDNQVLSYNAATGGFTWIDDANTDTNTEYTAGTLLDLSGTTFNVDLSEATETAVAVANDYFLFLDGGATGATKKEAIADLVAAMAGNNLSASNGVLSATDTNTNTTYSAGNGIALSSTTFSVAAGTGLSQASNGLALSHLGIESLSDPGADKILIWDDSAGAIAFATPNSNLAISGTNINATDTNTVYSVMGGGNSYAAGLVVTGSATHGDTFLRKDGEWATPTNTNTNQLTTFTLTADSGTNQTIAHGNTFDIAGGAGLATVVGATDTVTINLDIDGMTDIGEALVDADLMIVDNGADGTNRKATMSRLKTYMQNGLTFTTNTNTEYTAGTLLDLSGTTFNVDLSEATEAAVAVASDYVLFLDGGATGATKKESIVDLIAATAGTNLTAANGVLSATNTTYSAGTNISLSGTTFNVDDAFLVNNGNDTTTGTITAAGFTTAGSITLGGHAFNDIDVGDEFVDTDDHLMSSGAIREKIEDYGYSTTDTTYSAGTNISLSGTTFNVDDAFLVNNGNDTTTGTITAGGFTTAGSITLGGHAVADIDVGTEFVDTDDHLMSSGAIREKIEDYGYTTNTGDATLAGTQSFTGAKTFTSTLQGYKTVIKAVSSNTTLADADSGKTIYWTGGTLQLPPTAEVGQQFVIINNTNGAATPNLGTSNAVATNWTAHAAMADETARTYICPEANKWIYIG